MAWWDDAAEAVGSAVGWLGDAAEAVVDTATEVTEEVTESASDAADAGLDALRDGAASVGPALGAVANVVLGVVKGALHAVADLAATTFDVVRNVGKLLSDILHLNLADIIADLGNIGINILQLLVWGVRLVTGAYFGKEVSDYFMRDRALTFIRNLIIDEFGNKDGEDILRKLGSGSLHFGLPIAASTRIMAADSNTFPFVTLHNAGVIDLFALAGLLSFNSFRIARERTRVVRVNAAGGNVLFSADKQVRYPLIPEQRRHDHANTRLCHDPLRRCEGDARGLPQIQEAVHRHHLDSIIQFSELPGIPDTSLPERERFLLLCGQRWKRLLVVRRDHAAQRATGSRWNSALHRHLWLCGREKWPHQWPHHQARVERLPHLRRDQHDRRLHYRYCSAHA